MNGLIEKFGSAWTFRVIGLLQLATGLPAALLLKERIRPRSQSVFVDWSLFKDSVFVLLFIASGIVAFTITVPVFYLPLYSQSIGLSSSTGAGLVAGFNFSSAFGRIGFGFLADLIGPVNAFFLGLVLNALSMLILWPVTTTLEPLIAFVVINGIANGSFFATTPTIVGKLFGSIRLGVAMSMIITSWGKFAIPILVANLTIELGVGFLFGAPIAGYFLDAQGGADGGFKAYRPAIFYAGGLAAVGAALVGAVRINKDRRLLKKL
jgi:MFS family permease